MRRESFKPRIPIALVCLLVSQNLVNAGSPFITFGLNLVVATIVLIQARGRCRIPDRMLVAVTYGVLVWLLLVTLYRGGLESQIFLKYVRVPVAVSLMTVVFGSGAVEPKSVVAAINVSLGFHLALVLLQIALPDVTHFTAILFGFARDVAILDQYALRKLGASSSYDTASLFSLFALGFFYLQFHRSHSKRFLLITIVAFVAALMSSRTGIALALAVVTGILIYELRTASLWWKCATVIGATCFVWFAYVHIYPVFLHSFGRSVLDSGGGLFVSTADYGTTGTLDALTGEHLRPLDKPFWDLLIGFAVDPNTISEVTDIGYVKMIYHVGIVGTVLIMLCHAYMLVRLRRRPHLVGSGMDLDMIRRFLQYVILISLVVNYKSLELYSRGVGDFIFMLFLFIASCREPGQPRRSVFRRA